MINLNYISLSVSPPWYCGTENADWTVPVGLLCSDKRSAQYDVQTQYVCARTQREYRLTSRLLLIHNTFLYLQILYFLLCIIFDALTLIRLIPYHLIPEILYSVNLCDFWDWKKKYIKKEIKKGGGEKKRIILAHKNSSHNTITPVELVTVFRTLQDHNKVTKNKIYYRTWTTNCLPYWKEDEGCSELTRMATLVSAERN